MHNPSLWQVIGIGIVLGHAVIPNRNIIWLPAPAHLKLRFGDMGKQKPNKASLSFSLTSTIRVVKPSFTNSACLPLTGCVRTTGCSNGGIFRDRLAPALMFLLGFAVFVFRERFTEIMLRTQPAQQLAEGNRERLIGRNTAGPERITAAKVTL